MHILEQYALNCGVSISKPYISEEFFPLPFEKYITLHPKGKFPSREYDYWEEVTTNLFPILEKHNIKIVQVGGKEDQVVPFCYPTNGQTNLNNLAYLVKNSLLHLGVDSLPIHFASAFGKKIVGLYCNMYPNQSAPYWSSSEDCDLLFADLKGKKPSYAPFENPKTINTIKPEDIANSVLKKLNINETIKNKTIYFGDASHIRSVEIIPDHVPNLSSFNIDIANVRMDYYFNEIFLFNILSVYKTNILTDKAININELVKFKNNILHIYFIINDESNFDIKFIENLKNNGIKFSILSFIPEDKIEKIKIHTMDFCNIIIKDPQPNKEIIKSFKANNLKFKSSKLLLSQGKMYPSFQNYKSNTSYNQFLTEDFDFKEQGDLYKELQNFYIFSID
jgi:hypothetical protein